MEHLNPEIENLISIGLLTNAQIAEAIKIGLGDNEGVESLAPA